MLVYNIHVKFLIDEQSDLELYMLLGSSYIINTITF